MKKKWIEFKLISIYSITNEALLQRFFRLCIAFWIQTETRRLVNVRSHMMFRPELIYIFD